MYGSSRAVPLNFWVSPVCSCTMASTLVHRHDAQHVPVVVQDGHGEQIVLGDQTGHVLTIREGLHGNRGPGITHLDDASAALRDHQLAQRHHVDQPSVAGIEDIDGVYRLLGAPDLA